jgi:hypothetical protein
MVLTYKNKFNMKYGFSKDASHSVSDISKITGFKKAGLETIVDKGRGAYFSNPQSVRKSVSSPDQWGMARLYAVLMGSPALRIDASHLIKK